MTTKTSFKLVLAGSVAAALVPMLALAAITPSVTGSVKAGAQVSAAGVKVAATASTTATTKTDKAKARADQEIDRRVAALNALSARINAMQEVRADFKQNLTNAVSGQIAAFTSLKAKIDGESDLATLKTDIQSITTSYRIYALVLPQATIAAAADRVVTLTTMMTTLGSKLQTRIAAAQSAGMDVSSLSKALSDLSAKLSDANAQAQASVAVTASLVPDGGDKTKMAANTKALKTGRSDIATAQTDLKAARKDVAAILKGLKISTATTTPVSATSTTTTSATSSTTAQ